MSDSKIKEIPGMFNGEMYPLLVKLSIPILAGMVVQLLYNVADMFFISLINKSDPSYIGGTGMVFPFIFVAISLATGIMTGVGSVVARAIGERNESALNKAADSALALGILIGVAILIGGYLFSRPLISILGASGDFYTHGLTYFIYMLPFSALMVVLHAVAGIFQGEGKMKQIMVSMILGTVCNIILDPIFIFTLDMKVKGAALASVTGQVISLLYLITALGSKKNSFPIRWSLSHVSPALIWNITIIGFPVALSHMAMALSMMFFNRILVHFDKQAMTAFSLVGRFDQAVLIPAFALSSSLTTVVGQNAGRRNFGRIRLAWKSSIILGVSVVLLLALTHILIAPFLYQLFSTVPEVLQYCIIQTRILEVSFIFGVIGVIGGSVFQAIGFPFPALVLTIFRTLAVGLPLALFFSFTLGMKINGVYLGLMMANILTAIISLWWVLMTLSRMEKGELQVAAVSVE